VYPRINGKQHTLDLGPFMFDHAKQLWVLLVRSVLKYARQHTCRPAAGSDLYKWCWEAVVVIGLGQPVLHYLLQYAGKAGDQCPVTPWNSTSTPPPPRSTQGTVNYEACWDEEAGL